MGAALPPAGRKAWCSSDQLLDLIQCERFNFTLATRSRLDSSREMCTSFASHQRNTFTSRGTNCAASVASPLFCRGTTCFLLQRYDSAVPTGKVASRNGRTSAFPTEAVVASDWSMTDELKSNNRGFNGTFCVTQLQLRSSNDCFQTLTTF